MHFQTLTIIFDHEVGESKAAGDHECDTDE